MRQIIKLYHFLGGIYFTLILIASVTVFVIVGTLIESRTQSHLYAAHFTYDNPLFASLLWGFFLNILFSATRRWPFQVRHVPFLITHCGLLMILGGVLIKSYFGQQGTMSLIEGGGSDRIFEANTYAIQMEKNGELLPKLFELRHSVWGGLHHQIADEPDGLQLKLLSLVPNSTQKQAAWVKGDYVTISGLKPLPITEVSENQEDKDLIPNATVDLHGSQSTPWDIYALRTDHVETLLEKLYRQEARLHLTDRKTGKLQEISLKDAVLETDVSVKGNEVACSLDLNYSDIEGFCDPVLNIKVRSSGNRQKCHVTIPLDGEKALLNQGVDLPYLSSPSMAVDITRRPLIAVIEDMQGDVHFIAFNEHGQVWKQVFRCDSPQALFAFDEGFGGYAVQAEIPFPSYPNGRKEREKAITNNLTVQLREALAKNGELAPPLQLFQKECHAREVDFVDTFIAFLEHWDAVNGWLYPVDGILPTSLYPIFQNLDMSETHEDKKHACQWTAHLFEQMEPQIEAGDDIMDILRHRKWPLLSSLEKAKSGLNLSRIEENTHTQTLLTQQIFSAADMLPPARVEENLLKDEAHWNARLYTAYLRAYEIHLSTLAIVPQSDEMNSMLQRQTSSPTKDSSFLLQTSVVEIGRPLAPEKKVEDNIPQITLQAKRAGLKEVISVGYDRNASGLKWPILNGQYLIRFQPQYSHIPYRVRLRQARQINYANSQQAYSYESDLIVTDKRTGETTEKTISMNHVHETWDGYRFYLANIAPPNEVDVKRVQIVVNHDPAKYWLTYPGAIIMCCGIILLFSMRPYKK